MKTRFHFTVSTGRPSHPALEAGRSPKPGITGFLKPILTGLCAFFFLIATLVVAFVVGSVVALTLLGALAIVTAIVIVRIWFRRPDP